MRVYFADAAVLVPSHYSPLVPEPIWRANHAAARGVGGHSERTAYVDCRSDRVRKDLGGIPALAGPALPGRSGWTPSRRDPGGLRLAAQSAERGHPFESGRASPRDPAV